MHLKSERISYLINRVCVGVVSLVAGIHVDTPQIHANKGAGNRTTETGASGSFQGDDPQNAPRRANPIRFQFRWHDRAYFLGSIDFYNNLRKSLREKGLEYDGSYFESSWHRFGGARHVAPKTHGVPGLEKKDIKGL